MEKIIVTSQDLDRAVRPGPTFLASESADSPTLPWSRFLLFPLVAIPPLLCVAALVLWLSLRSKSAELRAAWAGYLCWLVVAAGLTTSLCLAQILIKRQAPSWPPAPQSLTALDSLTVFPDPAPVKDLPPTEIAATFKKHVFVVLAGPRAPGGRPPARGAIGACVLLNSDNKGHFLLTSRHVVDGSNWQSQEPEHSTVLLASETNEYATAQIVGRHTNLDLALLWLPRQTGAAAFTQSVREFSTIQEGEAVFLIGHPEGFLFSMSAGIVSQKRAGGLLQISAPVSPGNSGGPIFDAKGRLLAVVSWKVNKELSPNAENLNFGVRADAIFDTAGWKLAPTARALLGNLRQQLTRADARAKAPSVPPASPPN